MSLSKLIPQIADNINKARGARLDHDDCGHSYYTNGGIFQNQCKEIVRNFLDAAVLKLATEKRLTLPLLGEFSLSDQPPPVTDGDLQVLFSPAPKLTRTIEGTPAGKTASLKKEVASELYVTEKRVKEITDEMQRSICAALVSSGEFAIQSLGKFRITNEASSKNAGSMVQFRAKPFLRDLLAKVTDKQIERMVAKRAKKNSSRKKAAVSSGTLDRKRLARVRKLLHSRDPENVGMAMLVLEQIALPEDYVAVFETSGLMERLLRADSTEVVEVAAKIVAATKNSSVQKRFWKLIGLGSSAKSRELKIGKSYRSSVKDTNWICATTLEKFFLDTRNQSLNSISISSCSNLLDLRLAGLNQLSELYLGSNGLNSLHLEYLPALENAEMRACEKLSELTLSSLENLRKLTLDSCAIETLPEDIGGLCSLHKLDLSSNPLKALPKSIGQLSQLQTLNLSGNPLEALPKSIGQLSQLQTLNLSQTSLTGLPESIGDLLNLKTLDFSESALVELPASIGGLTALTELNLSSTRLESLPETIGQLKSLRKLILPANIKEVPRELAGLGDSCEMVFSDHSWQDDSDSKTTTRIILNLCRKLVAASGR